MRIYILDACALIAFKQVPVGQQWEFFSALAAALRDGHLHVPRMVVREVSDVAHPDAPGAWAAGNHRASQYQADPEWDTVAEVMSRASYLIDPDATDDPADPFVLAIAIELITDGHEPTIVTNDGELTMACGTFGVDSMDSSTFYDEYVRAALGF